MAKVNFVLDNVMDIHQYGEIINKAKVGDIIHIDGDWVTTMRRIADASKYVHKETFAVYEINPGTELFTIYGPSNVIVTHI